LSQRPFERFVRQIHRRSVLIRAVEHLAVCISIACPIALPILVLLLWRGQSTVPLLLVMGSLSFLAAVTVTIHRWPSILDAAAVVDRQLGWNDLLTTAIELGPSASDAMAGSVLAMADERCAQVSPAAVILNRYGARVWGGMALSLAAVIAVSLIPAHPIRSAVAQENQSILTNSGQSLDSSIVQRVVVNTNEEASSADSNRLTSRADSGTGGDFASTDHSVQSSPPADASVGKATSSSTGTSAGGGASADNADTGTSVAGLGSSTSRRNIGPWQSTGRETEPAAVDSTDLDVPARDRDLVRQYFDRN
jgi:hypothetical protein